MNEEIYLKLLLREPIYIKDMGFIYQPLIKDIVDIGENTLNNYINVMSLTKELFMDNNNNMDKDLTNFDIIFSITDKDYRNKLTKAIEFFTRQKVHFLKEVGFISIGKQGRLHQYNYDDFINIVLIMFNRQRTKGNNEKTKNMSEKQKEIYYKITKYRRDNIEKNRLRLSDIINIVKHGGSSFMTKEQIKNMTYFEMIKCFETIISKNNYEEFLQYKTSPNFKVEKSVPHWTISIKNN